MNIPFFESSDEAHCFQACIKMALDFFEPEKFYSDSEINLLTDAKSKKWTWQGKTLLRLEQLGYRIVNIENLDYEAFAKDGSSYLESIWDPQTFETQNQYSDLDGESRVAKDLIANKKISLLNQEVTFEDVEQLFNDGYVVMVSINPYILTDEEGYSSHLVVITDVSDKEVSFHDPGPPGIANRTVSKELFMKSCTKPHKPDNNLIALKLTKEE